MKNMLKKIVAAVMLVAMVALVFTGCSQKETDQLEAIKKAGKIKIAMEGAWAPWTYHDLTTNELIGFDTEVGQNIAKYLGVEAEFYEGEWDGLFAGLEGKRYDIIINGVEVTDKREEKYDFTDAYAYIKTALIVAEDNDTIHSFEDLKGKKTCNSTNSTYMLLAESYGATCQGVDSLEETLNMVEAGRVDATLNATVSFLDYMSVHPEAKLKVVALTEEASLVSIPTRKGDASANLRKAINEAIDAMRKDGTLARLSEKYFGEDITTK